MHCSETIPCELSEINPIYWSNSVDFLFQMFQGIRALDMGKQTEKQRELGNGILTSFSDPGNNAKKESRAVLDPPLSLTTRAKLMGLFCEGSYNINACQRRWSIVQGRPTVTSVVVSHLCRLKSQLTGFEHKCPLF